MEIAEFRSRPLTNRIVKQLVETTEAITELRTLIEANVAPSLLSDAVLIYGMRYYNAYKGLDYTYEETIIAIAEMGSTNKLMTQIKCFHHAEAIAINRVKEFEILSAIDLLEINETIKGFAEIQELETQERFNDGILNRIRSILVELYNPENHYPVLLEMAMALVGLLKLKKEYEISILTLDLFINTLLKIKGCAIGLSKYFIILEIEQKINEMSIESSAELLLKILERSARDSIMFIHGLNEEILLFEKDMKVKIPKIYIKKLSQIITQSFYMRNSVIEKEMAVTPKTAIAYMKVLEENGFLSAVKIGKEKIYINKRLIGIINDGL